MPVESNGSAIHGDTESNLLSGLTRRQFIKVGALAAGPFLFRPSPVHSRSDRRLLPVPFHYQRHALTCEIAALRMAAEYHGQVWAEDDLLKLMPRDRSQPHYEDGSLIWADPNRTFPGNIRGWQLYRGGLDEHPERARRGQWGYGVHAPTIADMAVRIGLAAELLDRVEAVYSAVDVGHVPIVIVPDGGRDWAVRWHWRTPQGKDVTVLNAEHSVVVRGYNDQTVWVNDPKGKVRTYPRDRFDRAFALLSSGVAIGPPCRVMHPKFKPM